MKKKFHRIIVFTYSSYFFPFFILFSIGTYREQIKYILFYFTLVIVIYAVTVNKITVYSHDRYRWQWNLMKSLIDNKHCKIDIFFVMHFICFIFWCFSRYFCLTDLNIRSWKVGINTNETDSGNWTQRLYVIKATQNRTCLERKP